MSKPTIKFIYSGQVRSEVQQIQKSPIPFQTFHGSFMQPPTSTAPLPPQAEQIIFLSNPTPISSMEIESKTQISQLHRYKSTGSIQLCNSRQEFEPNSPILNIEETNDDQILMFNQEQKLPPTIKGQTEQIVLKAPGYKFTPKRGGQIVAHSKKQYQKTLSVEKPLTAQTALKNKKSSTNFINGKEVHLKSSNAMMMVETIKQSDFHLDPTASSAPSSNLDMNFDGQIVLKAPKYKYTPKPEGEVIVQRKREYIRAQNSQKYLYQGVKVDRENDFISCFGCAKPQAKVYANTED